MTEPQRNSDKRVPRGPLLLAGLALLAVGLVVVIVKLIQAAPTAGQPGDGSVAGGRPPAAVFVAPVGSRVAGDEALVTGVLRAVSRAEIAAQEQGVVAEVFVDDGQEVTKGEPLVRLDARRIATQYGAAEAILKAARNLVTQREAELTRARSDLEMNRGLLQDAAISQSEFLDAERELAVKQAVREAAQEAVAEAESQLELLRIRQKDLEIQAPFDGVVTVRHVEPGEWVSAGHSVVTLVTVDPVEAWMSVPERYLGSVLADPDSLRVSLSSSGEVFVPTEVTIVPDVEPRSQLFTVVATLRNAGARLAPGQSITGKVPVGGREEYLIVPVDAVVRARTGEFVFVVKRSADEPLPGAEMVPVTIQFERDGLAFVRAAGSALVGNDQVVVEGNDRLQPGQPLLVREIAAKGEPELGREAGPDASNGQPQP